MTRGIFSKCLIEGKLFNSLNLLIRKSRHVGNIKMIPFSVYSEVELCGIHVLWQWTLEFTGSFVS